MKTRNKKIKQKMTIGIILLLIFLIWSLFSTISRIFLRNTSTDIQILNHYDLSVLGYLIFIVIIILNVLAIYAIFYRKKGGYKVLIYYFALHILITIFIFILGLIDLEAFKEAAILSRTSRGLSIERIDIVANPIIIIITALFYSAFYLVLIWYVHKKKNYFLNHNANSIKPKK